MHAQILPRVMRTRGPYLAEESPVRRHSPSLRAVSLAVALVAFNGVDNFFSAITYAATLISDTYWASALFALLLLRARAWSQGAERAA